MTHAIYVLIAYGFSAIVLGALLIGVFADQRGRRRELAELEKTGIRRRSERETEA